MRIRDIKIVEAARKVLRSHGYFVDNLWHTDDVRLICEQQLLPQLTDAEAMEVFAIANQQFDGETGISWPQLEKAVQLYHQRYRPLRREEVQTMQHSSS